MKSAHAYIQDCSRLVIWSDLLDSSFKAPSGIIVVTCCFFNGWRPRGDRIQCISEGVVFTQPFSRWSRRGDRWHGCSLLGKCCGRKVQKSI